ncbi:hypothetical protein [Rhodanobacter glycinis]|nr:hypothetical protein [Rhodanobacter glycinis]
MDDNGQRPRCGNIAAFAGFAGLENPSPGRKKNRPHEAAGFQANAGRDQ